MAEIIEQTQAERKEISLSEDAMEEIFKILIELHVLSTFVSMFNAKKMEFSRFAKILGIPENVNNYRFDWQRRVISWD